MPSALQEIVPEETFVDVLIIGAGPAGVMAANALVQAGVSVRIIDMKPSAAVAGQADGCQPRTLEVLQSYGLLDNLMKRGQHVWKATFYNPSASGGIEKTASGTSITDPTARWPFPVTYPQSGVEGIFLQAMHEAGLEVSWSTIPTSIETSKDESDLKNPQAYVSKVVVERIDRIDHKTEAVRAKFVIGADGAHSWTRKAIGIRMEGDTHNSVWGAVDLVPDSDFPDVHCMSYVHSNAGTLFTIPRENDLVRLYIQQSAEANDLIDPATGRVDKNRSSPEKLLEQGRKILAPYTIKSKDGVIDWWTIYVVGQRVADRYTLDERVFIAGDACHTHTPKAGQGMNAGLADTHNIAWKIAYVLRGWANMSLLSTYESERRAFAQDLIAFDKVWSKLFVDKPRTERSEDGVSHDQFKGMFEKSSRFISGTMVEYAPSLIVDTSGRSSATKLIIGQRMPPHVFIRAADARPFELQDLLPSDTRFKILVFGGDLAISAERAALERTATMMGKPDAFLARFGRGQTSEGEWKSFSILSFSSAKNETVSYLDFPELFREKWSQVLLDDTDLYGRTGGGGYAYYGIDSHAGAIVVVRPDGYVGMVAPLDRVDLVNEYFEGFLLR